MYMKCIDRGKLLIDILQTFLSVYMHHKNIQWKVQIVFQQSASIRRLQYFLEKHAKLFFAPAVFCVFCVTIAKNGFSSIYIYIVNTLENKTEHALHAWPIYLVLYRLFISYYHKTSFSSKQLQMCQFCHAHTSILETSVIMKYPILRHVQDVNS